MYSDEDSEDGNPMVAGYQDFSDTDDEEGLNVNTTTEATPAVAPVVNDQSDDGDDDDFEDFSSSESENEEEKSKKKKLENEQGIKSLISFCFSLFVEFILGKFFWVNQKIREGKMV